MKKLFKVEISMLVLFISLISIGAVFADGFRNPPESASALGRIGGKIVHTEDASAATINPANITKIENPSIMVSLTAGYGTKEFTSAIDGSTTDTKDNMAYLPSIYATINLLVKWQATNGWNYSLQESTDLLATTWGNVSDATNLPGINGIMCVTNSSFKYPRQFYRIISNRP